VTDQVSPRTPSRPPGAIWRPWLTWTTSRRAESLRRSDGRPALPRSSQGRPHGSGVATPLRSPCAATPGHPAAFPGWRCRASLASADRAAVPMSEEIPPVKRDERPRNAWRSPAAPTIKVKGRHAASWRDGGTEPYGRGSDPEATIKPALGAGRARRDRKRREMRK
jgi:hypothetical protein